MELGTGYGYSGTLAALFFITIAESLNLCTQSGESACNFFLYQFYIILTIVGYFLLAFIVKAQNRYTHLQQVCKNSGLTEVGVVWSHSS